MLKQSTAMNMTVNFLRSLSCYSDTQIRKVEEALSGKAAPERPLLLKQRDLARELCVCRQSVAAWEKAGKIKPVLLPDGQKRYRLQDIIKEEKNE